MRLGIVSDIHSNAPGLQRALDLMGDVDELLCLGDAIFEYRFSNEVAALLRDRGAHVIQGNHEEVFFSPAGIRAREREGLDPGLLRYLADQPHRRRLEFGGKSVLLVHSTPWEPRGAYVYPHSPTLARFAEADADFVLYGHTHVQMVQQVGRVLVINPGSAGDARDHGNGRLLSCAVLDTATEDVQVIDYPDPRHDGSA
ncbi:MAG TPA: metallophosphoesterase family protein [Acetobacteraceae bacterium]|nr:metallophosphoesterase family protein [Acetobacteraceae bacterium]